MHHARLGARAATLFLPCKLQGGATAVVFIVPELDGLKPGSGQTLLRVLVVRCHVLVPLVAETSWIQSYSRL